MQEHEEEQFVLNPEIGIIYFLEFAKQIYVFVLTTFF